MSADKTIKLILAIWHGIFCFFQRPAYGWLLSATAVPLYISYTLHNIVAWIKIKPFLPVWGGRFFIISLIVVQPYWVLEAYSNFSYFNDLGQDWFESTRYFEPLARDPWWIFTTVKLVLVINKNYEYTIPNLIRTSPRFGVMLLCMFVSIIFLVTDVIVTALVSVQSGINPFWRVSNPFSARRHPELDTDKTASSPSSSSALPTPSSSTTSSPCSTASPNPPCAMSPTCQRRPTAAPTANHPPFPRPAAAAALLASADQAQPRTASTRHGTWCTFHQTTACLTG